jgi:hypothetical protein
LNPVNLLSAGVPAPFETLGPETPWEAKLSQKGEIYLLRYSPLKRMVVEE